MYDVFVIGSGVAGQTAAFKCAEAGLKVAVADSRAYGGTCANRGCDPKKVLLEAGEIMNAARQLKGKGITSIPEISWRDLQAFKKTFTYNVPAGTEKKLKEAGIDLYHQSPVFKDEHTIMVEGKEVQSRHFVIATGLKPVPLDFEGSNLLNTSDDFLQLEELPETAVFIGGGYIGMEFSHLLSMLGCKVTVIDSGNEILSNFDANLAALMRRKTEEMGIEIILNAQVERVEMLVKNKRLHYSKNDVRDFVDAKVIFNSAGRVPAIEKLNLKKAGVKTTSEGVVVNDYLQSVSTPHFYACGDVAARSLPLTPLSGRHGGLVGENIISGNSQKETDPLVPSTVFTYPNLSSVGLSEKEAKSRYKNVIVRQGEVSDWFSVERKGEALYAYKILINERTNVIVGAHLAGPLASEVINLFMLAIANEMTVSAYKSLVFTYPTLGHDTLNMLNE